MSNLLELKTQVEQILSKYHVEYADLAERSEKLHEEAELLRKSYSVLEKKTGLNALYEEIAALQKEF